MNFATARENMIESQVRPNGITDGRVIKAMAAVARESFLGEGLRSLAYMDEDVQLEAGDGAKRYLMKPMVFAKLLQLAEIRPDDFVLDVACATGYSCAVLSHLSQSVVGVEENAALASTAADVLNEGEFINTAVLNKPHTQGCRDEAPFNVIVVNGRVAKEPTELLAQLAEGGRLVAVHGGETTALLNVWKREGDRFIQRSSGNASLALLAGFEVEDPGFVF